MFRLVLGLGLLAACHGQGFVVREEIDDVVYGKPGNPNGYSLTEEIKDITYIPGYEQLYPRREEYDNGAYRGQDYVQNEPLTEELLNSAHRADQRRGQNLEISLKEEIEDLYGAPSQISSYPVRRDVYRAPLSNDFPQVGASCPKAFTYVDIGSCDSYIECKDNKPLKQFCLDGLHFNAETKWPKFPCDYPSETPCRGRSYSRSPQPTEECPRQYGYYEDKMAAAGECGKYIQCVAGRAVRMSCPLGLAFNVANSTCDFAYNVPSCKSESFFNVRCPPGEVDESGNPVVTNIKYDNSCRLFFSCQSGQGRVLSCDPGLAFNARTGRCEDAETVDCRESSDSMYTRY